MGNKTISVEIRHVEVKRISIKIDVVIIFMKWKTKLEYIKNKIIKCYINKQEIGEKRLFLYL